MKKTNKKKPKKNKLNSLITKDYHFSVLRIYFTSNDGSQNTFLHQPTLDALELKKDEGTDYVLSWKSKGVFSSKLKPLYAAFLQIKKLSEYRIGIKFYKDSLAVEQNNYWNKVVNAYIAYDLDAWPRNPAKNSKFNNCLFRETNILNNSDKKSMYIVDTEQNLIVQVHGVLIITLLEML